MSSDTLDAIVVGGGLAGLAAARVLQGAGLTCTVLEASDAPGGRVRTDVVAGFRLDRGFQVFLTAYPEARRVLDYAALDLRAFAPGALVRYRGAFHRVADPFRAPLGALATLVAPVGSLGDKLAVVGLRRSATKGSVAELLARPEVTAAEHLRRHGVGPRLTGTFFRPFFGGITFDPGLGTSSRFFELVFRYMAEDVVALPAAGMGAIPEQLASRLVPGTVHTGVRVAAIEDGGVRLADGTVLAARAVVLATEAPEAARLAGLAAVPDGLGVTCLYFALPVPRPVAAPILLLDGDGDGPALNVVFPSAVVTGYAPPGQDLVSATVLGVDHHPATLETRVRAQLAAWFGAAVESWQHLRTYRIPYGLPAQPPGALEPPSRPVRLRPGLYVAGDHVETASIDGALCAGRRAAEAAAADLGT